MWGFASLETLVQDMRYGMRMLRKNPGFTAVAIVTLALGIGATTSVFSVVDRILFRTLPFSHCDRLVSVGIVATPIDRQEFLFAGAYQEWRAAQTPFEAVTSWSGISDCDLTEPNPKRLSCAQVEDNFLPTLGIEPVLGRNFTWAEDLPYAPKAAILSYGLWEDRFGRDRDVVGKTILLDGQPATVVGILPPRFELPNLARADVLIPEVLTPGSQRMRDTTGHRAPQAWFNAPASPGCIGPVVPTDLAICSLSFAKKSDSASERYET